MVILAAGVSPAWQHVLLVEDLQLGEVNRAKQARWCAAGKVLNVAAALHRLGADSKSLTLVGGESGAAIKRDFKDLGANAVWVDVDAATRVCTTLVDTTGNLVDTTGNTTGNIVTELVEPSGPLRADELARFTDNFEREAAAANIVVFTGSLPAGTPPTICRDLLARCDGRFILDIRGAELTAALPQRPFLVKPNRAELATTLGRSMNDDDALIEAMRELNHLGAEWVMITDGERMVHVTSKTETYQLRPPVVDAICPIGCGDCLAAALAAALDEGRDWPDALRFSVAAAASKLGNILPGQLDPTLALDLESQVLCTRL